MEIIFPPVPTNYGNTSVAADDPIDKLAATIKARKPVKKAAKAQRTLMFAEPNFTTLQRYCRAKDIAVGEVLDELITAFLSKVADDLPQD